MSHNKNEELFYFSEEKGFNKPDNEKQDSEMGNENVVDFEKKMYVQFDFEVKTIDDNDDEFFRIEGFASTFGNIDRVDDVVQAGAFAKTIALRRNPIPMLFNHSPNKVIGVFDEAKEQEGGLFVKGKMSKSDPEAQRLFGLLKMKALNSFSIGFSVKEFEIQDGIRILKEIDLFEVSVVTFPANTEAAITAVKSYEEADVNEVKTPREFEELLKKSGAFSNRAAKYLSSNFVHKQWDAAEDNGDETDQRDVEEAESKGAEEPATKQDFSELKELLSDIKEQTNARK